MKKLQVLTALTLSLILLLTGCSYFAKTPEQVSITVIDDMNREVILSKLPTHIVSLAPSNTELLFALGLNDKIMGVTDVCNFPPEALDKEKIGGFSQPSVEKILSLKADLVIAASLHKEVVEQLDALGVPVIVLNATSISQVLANIELLGKATGTSQAADTLKKEIEAIISQVENKGRSLTEAQRPLVFYEVWNDPIWTAGPNTFIDEMITLAGGINMAADAPSSYVEYSFEVLLARDPQVMFYGHAMETIDEVLGRKDWGSVSAIKNNRVYPVDEDVVLRPGPRIGLGLLELAKSIHPELWD